MLEHLEGNTAKYAQSHQNDPLGAAVVREVVSVIRDDSLVDRARELGAALAEGLKAIMARRSRVRAVRTRGLMAAVDLEDDAAASYTAAVHHELVNRGYVVARRPGLNVLRIDPALTVERADIEGFLATFDDILAEQS
jgi:acetylornithine aminotransferase